MTFGWKGLKNRALELPAGDDVAVAPLGQARIRYNLAANRPEISLSGAAYTSMAGISPSSLYDTHGVQRFSADPSGDLLAEPATTITTESPAAYAPIVVDQYSGVRTTNASIATAASFAVADGEVIKFTAEVMYRSVTDGDSGSSTLRGVAENTEGILTIIGGPLGVEGETAAEDATWGTIQGSPVIVNASGANLRVRVEGAAGDIVIWNVTLHIVRSKST